MQASFVPHTQSAQPTQPLHTTAAPSPPAVNTTPAGHPQLAVQRHTAVVGSCSGEGSSCTSEWCGFSTTGRDGGVDGQD